MIFIQVRLQLAMSLASTDVNTVTPISHSLSRRSYCHPARIKDTYKVLVKASHPASHIHVRGSIG
jgi:hypothetical protein